MSFALGVALFAAALLLSVAWHELGHMWAAQATGMKVRRYFVGFGPTAWSTRRGETEYGLKWLPLGGFCDIAGMTPHEELTADERERAMYRQSAWKRLVVLFAGPAQNFILGFLLVIVLAVGWGLPNLDGEAKVYVDRLTCVAPTTDAQGTPVECTGVGPAQQAGLEPGDQVVAINGHEVKNAEDLVLTTWEIKGTADVEVLRDGATMHFAVPVTQVQRMKKESDGSLVPVTVSAIGIGLSQDSITHYNVFTAIPASIGFTGDLLGATWDALLSLPSKIGALWTAVTGGERSADTPVSVYGASVIGGQAAERGAWSMFIGLLISVNLFLGFFNLIPLLPLDGGHMAIVFYEKIRNAVRRRFGRAAAGPVDYLKLMPITYAVVVVLGGFMVLTLTADIVNPIQIF